MKKIKYILKPKHIVKKKKYESLFNNWKIISMSTYFSEQLVNNEIFSSASISNTSSFERWIYLMIPAQEANLMPPVGPILGQHGFNTNTFCNIFNKETSVFSAGVPLRVMIKLFSDKSVLFQIFIPPTSLLIKSNLEDWNMTNKKISLLNLFKISLIKQVDYPKKNIEEILQNVVGTSSSMGIKIIV